MRIGIDAMGGDYAPSAVVDGVLQVREWITNDITLVLFGDKTLLQEEFAKRGAETSEYEIVHCSEVITMNDHPVSGISKKTDSSITVGFQYLASGKIDGFASAGNTGAMMAGTMAFIKTVPGLTRPAIAAYIPVNETQCNLVLDAGLNSDCKPEVLVQYGVLGSLYSQYVFGVETPRVGLLNIGAEAEKGNITAKATHELMASCTDFHFAGNIEGNELFSNKRVDVIVCDGFVGNIVLKEAESFYMIAKERGIDDPYLDRFNFEHYGGTPVLGVNAPVIIGHGISNGRAINNMIRQTSKVIGSSLCAKFKQAFHV
jgi:fatty acid/phospholipid synthesis protein plsX